MVLLNPKHAFKKTQKKRLAGTTFPWTTNRTLETAYTATYSAGITRARAERNDLLTEDKIKRFYLLCQCFAGLSHLLDIMSLKCTANALQDGRASRAKYVLLSLIVECSAIITDIDYI